MKLNKNQQPLFSHITHSLLMIHRNKLVYIKLSVTVILSFSLLFGFLFLTDTRLYNEYKEVFAQPSDIVLSNIHGNAWAYDELISQINKTMGQTDSYGYITMSGNAGYQDIDLTADCSFLPNGEVPMYTRRYIDFKETGGLHSVEPIKLLGEKKNFVCKGDEVIINESWYQSLIDGGAEKPVYISMHFDWTDGTSSDWQLKVVGICSDAEYHRNDTIFHKEGIVSVRGSMYLSAELLSRTDVGEFENMSNYWVFMHTPDPAKAIDVSRGLKFTTYSVFEAQESAKEMLQLQNKNKGYMAAIILILLSLNLYSSFSNAMKERRYEIGVKRAIGARKQQIVRQFLYESLCVLLFDTLFSSILIVDLMIGYKIYQTFFLNNHFILFLSPYSVGMFLACALSLSIVFSLIFAFQSTKVDIVKNLRKE